MTCIYDSICHNQQRVECFLGSHTMICFLQSSSCHLVTFFCGCRGEMRHGIGRTDSPCQFLIDIIVSIRRRVPQHESLRFILYLRKSVFVCRTFSSAKFTQSKLIKLSRSIEPSILNDEMLIRTTSKLGTFSHPISCCGKI